MQRGEPGSLVVAAPLPPYKCLPPTATPPHASRLHAAPNHNCARLVCHNRCWAGPDPHQASKAGGKAGGEACLLVAFSAAVEQQPTSGMVPLLQRDTPTSDHNEAGHSAPVPECLCCARDVMHAGCLAPGSHAVHLSLHRTLLPHCTCNKPGPPARAATAVRRARLWKRVRSRLAGSGGGDGQPRAAAAQTSRASGGRSPRKLSKPLRERSALVTPARQPSCRPRARERGQLDPPAMLDSAHSAACLSSRPSPAAPSLTGRSCNHEQLGRRKRPAGRRWLRRRPGRRWLRPAAPSWRG